MQEDRTGRDKTSRERVKQNTNILLVPLARQQEEDEEYEGRRAEDEQEDGSLVEGTDSLGRREVTLHFHPPQRDS